MFKRIMLFILVIIFVTSAIMSCGKKEKPKEIVYNGSVMLFTDMDESIIKALKTDFETNYKGLVLDYFVGDLNNIRAKIDESYDIDYPEADIVICEDISYFEKLSSSKHLNQYVSKEDKNINDSFKLKDKDYCILCSKDSDNYMMALLSNSLNVDSGKILVDYLLSKKGQELLVVNGLKSVRKDIK